MPDLGEHRVCIFWALIVQLLHHLLLGFQAFARLLEGLGHGRVIHPGRNLQRLHTLILQTISHAGGNRLPGLGHGLHFGDPLLCVSHRQLEPGLWVAGHLHTHSFTPGFHRIKAFIRQAILRRDYRGACAPQNQCDYRNHRKYYCHGRLLLSGF